jgi:hypothetical protein
MWLFIAFLGFIGLHLLHGVCLSVEWHLRDWNRWKEQWGSCPKDAKFNKYGAMIGDRG